MVITSMPPQMDADSCKTEGNAAMAEQDYVNAMKWYSQAIALSPRDGALFSNRSFAFLRLNLPARALADAEEAIRRRPTWPKGHFRRAEALTQAGLHAEALLSYEAGASLDPSDEHLQAQCVEARAREAAARTAEKGHVAISAAVGLFAILLLARDRCCGTRCDTGTQSQQAHCPLSTQAVQDARTDGR